MNTGRPTRRQFIFRPSVMITLMASLCLTAPAAPSRDFTPLFDGETLAGWTALPGGEWSVDHGELFGRQDQSEARHGQLISDRQFSNFILKLKYKAIAGNSGVYFRVQKVDHVVAVKGFQAEVDANGRHNAGLYETLGRAWVSTPDPDTVKSVYKPREWNQMSITAMDGNITVVLNGVVMTTLVDDPGLRSGHIALQLHGGQDMDVRYKDIHIREFPSGNYPTIHDDIHDRRTRTLPPIVAPKTESELAASAKPPPGAVVLFDGSNTDAWDTRWPVMDGALQTGQGSCMTKDAFGDCRLHVEWRVTNPESDGNSGIFLMSQYEVQVFNSHQNRTSIYADGQAGAIYGQYPPRVNACRVPGEWEFYDFHFTAPRFDDSGQLAAPARITAHHNGHLIQDDIALTGPTGHDTRAFYNKNETSGPLGLQQHGDILQFRNIWILRK